MKLEKVKTKCTSIYISSEYLFKRHSRTYLFILSNCTNHTKKRMKFTTLLASATTLALTQARTVRFWTESNTTEVDDRGIYSIHEGAGVNYVLLDGEPQNYTITDFGLIYYSSKTADGTGYYPALQIVDSEGSFPSLELSVSQPNINWLIDDGYLSGNGSSNFWAAKNTNDPYNYTQTSYTLGLFLDNSQSPTQYTNAAPVKVKAEILDESN